MSKRARAAANKRENARLFPPGFWDFMKPQAETPAQHKERLLHQARELRGLAERGMHPRSYRKRAEELELEARSL